jgi:regulator of replication initiation timing
MNSYNFIADMNGLQQEFASLPAEVVQIVASLTELVEEQERLIRTMLVTNKKLLKRLDE